MGRPWCGIQVGFSYAYSPKWEATRGSCLGRVNGGRPDSQLCFGPVPVWDKFCATRWLEPCGGSVGMTPGYPGHDLCKRVGDAVRGTRGISVSLGMSSSLLTGLVPRILWDVFRGFGRRTSSMCGERVQTLQSQIYSNSRVLGHGTQFVLGHTRSTRNC